MDIIEKKTVDMLTVDSVSILTQKFVEFEGELNQVGKNHRCGYDNSEEGRKLLQENEPENVVTAVFAIWGDTPTVTYPEVESEMNSEVGSESEVESEMTSESASESEEVLESEVASEE